MPPRSGDFDTAALDDAFVSAAVSHMNQDHRDAVLAYARAFGGAAWATDARLLRLDSTGMDIVATDGQQEHACRIPFPSAPIGASELRRVLVELARDARSRLP